MRCKYCGFANGEDDHRCLRCGRRTPGVVIAAPASYSGANALAMAPAFETKVERLAQAEETVPQRALFSAEAGAAPKVIPFDQLRQATGKLPVNPQARSAAPARTQTRKTSPLESSSPGVAGSPEQIPMDFVPSPASAPRTLKTAVPAQIYCDHPVATPIHRFVAGAMDASMILLAFGLFLVLAQFTGGSFGEGKLFWGLILGSFVLISLFYGLLWTMCGRETAGMSWTELELVTFDGFAVERRARAIRTAASWLSFCAGGIGVLWATADEEKLAWHDHISKTFPTLRDSGGSFNRQRR